MPSNLQMDQTMHLFSLYGSPPGKGIKKILEKNISLFIFLATSIWFKNVVLIVMDIFIFFYSYSLLENIFRNLPEDIQR